MHKPQCHDGDSVRKSLLNAALAAAAGLVLSWKAEGPRLGLEIAAAQSQSLIMFGLLALAACSSNAIHESKHDSDPSSSLSMLLPSNCTVALV